VSTLFVAQYFEVSLPSFAVASLGVAVWIIYTIDHLLDGSKSNDIPRTLRHQFHQTHRKPIFMVLIVMLLAGMFLVTQLPISMIVNGVIMSVGVSIYFIGLRLIGTRPSIYKEPLVALAYALGVFLGPVSMSSSIDVSKLILFFVLYALMAFINLLIFSVYELEIDQADNHTSLVRYIGKRKTAHLINTSFFGLAILFVYHLSILKGFELHSVAVFSMIVVLAAVNYWKSVFGLKERYRILGDAVFYFPIIALI
jgi:hypothetical protein